MLDYMVPNCREGQRSDRLEAAIPVHPVCGEAVSAEIANLHALAEEWVIDQIRNEHPEWVEDDGLCPRCMEHYLSL